MSPTLAAPHRFTKIMPTLGPSSWDEATIEQLILAGANAFRLNFSHADAARHRQTAANVRAVAARLGRHIPLLQDLQGPKLRIGQMQQGVVLQVGQTFMLDLNPTPGDSARAPLPHPEILAALQVGDTVSLNDGVLRLVVVATAAGVVTTTVTAGGILSSHKGLNAPGRRLPVAALTDKDLADLVVGRALGVDYVALSFVQTAEDLHQARPHLAPGCRLMAKIETQAAIQNLEAIIAASDAVMIARGDLGVELPPEEVPPLQRTILAKARESGKPAVVATQMLESMIESPVPTRAEASDVATATYAGADCLMLSAESASGKHPVEAVAVMARIIARAEASELWHPQGNGGPLNPAQGLTASCATSTAAATLAQQLHASAMVGFTETGATSLNLARTRTPVPQIGLTPHAQVARQLMLVWGVMGTVCPPVHDTDSMVQAATQAAQTAGLLGPAERMVITAGIPFGASGTTNLIRVVSGQTA
ncbi:MAG: pyruvate kinase [Alphaproteobacteria bacterium]|jgi:pyruvate kinase|nr:pyruvate kinase [Alphaproteobacteria bacterium]